MVVRRNVPCLGMRQGCVRSALLCSVPGVPSLRCWQSQKIIELLETNGLKGAQVEKCYPREPRKFMKKAGCGTDIKKVKIQHIERTYLQIIYLIRDLFLEHIKNS